MALSRWHVGTIAFATFLFALVFASPARGAPPAPPALVPPRSIEMPSVPYPPDASGSASVILELTIDPQGHVSNARVADGTEPFASAALASASIWRFEPARRGDVAVAARIRMLVDFHPPPPKAADDAPAPQGADAGARETAPPHIEAIEEVIVQGARHEVARTELGAADVRQMPGAFGDAFRAIDALPGVVPMVSGLPYYFIRGAPPGNTGYMIDGVRVPLLFHFGVARAVVHPALIDHVDFYASGFPAKYGRFAGGIIDGRTTTPTDRLHGEWDVSLLDVGAYAETPFADGRGTVGVAGRYGYPGLLLSLLAPKVFLQYGDYQARASWRVNDKDTVSVFVFGSVDAGGTKQDDGSIPDLTSTQFHRVDARWDHDLGKLGHVRTAVTLGLDETANPGDFTIRDLLLGMRTEWEVQATNDVRVRAGSDAWFDHYSLLGSNADTTVNQFPTRDDVTAGVWADAIVRVSPTVEIVPGARIDYFESKSTVSSEVASVPTFDPRVATRVRASKRVTWITTNGITHQAPSFLVPVPGLELGTLSKGVQTAFQTSQGAEVLLPADFTLTTTFFLTNTINMTDATATCTGTNIDVDKDCIDQRVRGRAFGFELLLRRPLTKRLAGWIAYTLSRSTREAHDLGSTTQTTTILSDFDRTHVLNVVGTYDLGRNWRIGARTLFYTGRPYSNEIQGVAVPPFNDQRLPGFFRLDVRLEKRWLTKTGYIAFVAEGLNVTANAEVLDVKCTPQGGAVLDKCVPDTSGSIPVIVPLIGLDGAF